MELRVTLIVIQVSKMASNESKFHKCIIGWVHRHAIYTVMGFNDMVIHCNEMDICVNKLSPVKVVCEAPKICLPNTNYSYFCGIIFIVISLLINDFHMKAL